MATPSAQKAYDLWLQTQDAPKKKKGVASVALHLAKEYGLSVALGAGTGFLVGGPPGAAIGAATGVAGQFAAPRAAKALPEGTPDWVRTGVEYGVYGATAPLGLGGAARAGEMGLSKIATRVALPEALKLGLATGVSAVGGKEAAKVLGAPEGVGELVGSLAAPFAAPMAWRSARQTLAAAADNPDARLANRIRTALKIEAPEAPKANPVNTIVASRARSVEATKREADMMTRKVERLNPVMDDSEWRKITGGWGKEDAKRMSQGMLPAEAAKSTSKGFRFDFRKIPTVNEEWTRKIGLRDAAAQNMEDARQSLVTAQQEAGRFAQQGAEGTELTLHTDLADKLREVDFSEENHPVAKINKLTKDTHTQLLDAGYNADEISDVESKLDEFKQVTRSNYERGEDGTAEFHDDKQSAWEDYHTALDDLTPPAVAGQAGTDLTQFEMAHRIATLEHGTANEHVRDVERRLRTRLGLEPGDEIPTDLNAQEALLREKHNLPEHVDLGEFPSQADSVQRYREGLAAEKLRATKVAGERDKLMVLQKHLNDFHEFLKNDNNFPGMAVKPKMLAQAAHQYAAIGNVDRLIAKYPAGFNKAKEALEPLGEYIRMANMSTATVRDADRSDAFKAFFTNPRGTPYMKDVDGAVHRVNLIDIAPPAKDLVKKLGSSGWVATIRPNFSSATQAVPIEQLFMRYSNEQLTARAAEWAATAENLRNNVGSTGELEKLNKIIDGIAPPQAISDEVYFRDRASLENAQKVAATRGLVPPSDLSPVLDEQRAAAWQSLADHFTPESNTLEGNYPTHEAALRAQRGMLRFVMKQPSRSGYSAGDVRDFLRDQQALMQPLVDRLTALKVIDDPEMLGSALPDGSIDPMKWTYDLLGVSVDDLTALTEAEKTKLFGSTKQMMRRITGEALAHPFVKSIAEMHYGMQEALSNEVGAQRMPIITELRRTASELAHAPTGLKAQARAGLNAAVHQGLHPVRALNAFTRELHPLAQGVDELNAMMYDSFSLEGLLKSPSKAYQQYGKDLIKFGKEFGNDRLDEFIRSATSNPAMFAEFPEAFPKLVANKKMNALAEMWNNWDTMDAKLSNVFESRQITKAQRFGMMTAKDFRKDINQDIFDDPNSTVVTLASELLRAAKSKGNEHVPLSKLMTSGTEAAMAGPMAVKQSMLIQNTVSNIKKLAKPGQVIGPKDLLFRGGEWNIRSLTGKFPEGMRDSLIGLQDLLSGNYGGLESVTKLSQTIALGTLAADLSLVGIHGMKFASQALLSGHPVQAVSVLKNGMTHIMTDYGFYSWLKTNHDDLRYFAEHGLTGGLKGYIAGPDITRMPLESIPLIGKAVTGIREFSDLQYNRMLYYWKVEAVRMNMEFAQNMRVINSDLAKKFVGDSPNAKAVQDAMGGFDAYKLGSTDELTDAVIRQVNNSLGGIDLRAKGISAHRQAIEQIAFIVPGFTRAQIGQWATILTKPNTLEGWLAASMVGREAMFGASVALGMSRMLGTENEINWDNPGKSDWLAVHTPDGGYVSVMSTMAIPRMLSRSISETVNGAKGIATGEGGGFNYAKTLEAFAHGRLSAGASAVYDLTTGKDFLGRNYKNSFDKWSSAVEHVTMPIVVQSVADDLKESMRSGGIDPKEVLLQSGAQIIGKGYVPESPSAKLNKISQQALGTDWGLLTSDQRVALEKSNPDVAGVEKQYNFENSRKNSSAEAHIDAAYENYAATAKHVWNDPIMYKGVQSTQGDDDHLLLQGAITGDDWRERYHRRQEAVSDSFAALQDKLKLEHVDPEKVRVARLERLAKAHSPSDFAWLTQLAESEYAGIDLPTVNKTFSGPNGDVVVQTVDWDQYKADREDVLARYPDAIRQQVLAGNPDQTSGVTAYKAAAQWQQTIEDTPRYRGLNNDQGDKLDQMRSVISAAQQQVSAQIGLPAGTPAPAGVSQASKAYALKLLQQQKLLLTPEDAQLAQMAFAFGSNPGLAEAMANPQQTALILAHPDAAIFYPYLVSRVPKPLRNRLPPQLQPQAQLQAGALKGQ